MAINKPVLIVGQMCLLVACGATLGLIDKSRRPAIMVVPPEIAPLPPSTPKDKPADTPTGQTPATKPTDTPKTPDQPKQTDPTKPVENPTAPPPQPPPSTPPAEKPPAQAATGEEQIDPELVKQGHITVAQAWDLFNQPNPAFFIDSRHKPEYEDGHVKGAFRLPLDAFKGQEPAHMQVMGREETYVVYCIGGNCDESTAVQKQLLLAGYQKVYVMHAGYPGWVSAGHPTEKGEDPIEAAQGRP